MNITAILTAAALVGGLGIIIGLLLGVASEKFKVEVNEKEIAVRELLPGNNCGGCGFAGCDALAKAIAEGTADVAACPVGGSAVAEQIAGVMGVDSVAKQRMTAFVKCAGTCDKSAVKYNYFGISDCSKAFIAPGHGSKACSYGCMGLGSCVAACPFDAIHIANGVAAVDKEACKACGRCVAACPNHLIELVPYSAEHLVRCNSKDKGKTVKESCSAGCIGCSLCAKNCEAGAITVENNLARIDYSLCTGCGKCKEKCPVKVIK